MSDEEAFLAGIRAQPSDDLRRLVYADWLEERGTDEADLKAEYIRLSLCEILEHELLEKQVQVRLLQLASLLPTDWKAAVARLPIETCPPDCLPFCPKIWDQLLATEDTLVRIYAQCRRSVYYCDSLATAQDHSSLRQRRVVLDLRVNRSAGDLPDTSAIVNDPFADMLDPAQTRELREQLGQILRGEATIYMTPTDSGMPHELGVPQIVSHTTPVPEEEPHYHFRSGPVVHQRIPVNWKPIKPLHSRKTKHRESLLRRLWRKLTGR